MVQRRNCKVVLERLDEETLKNCLEKYGLKLASQNACSKQSIQRKSQSKTDKSETRNRRRRKNLELFIEKSQNFKRKKVKPLCYTDDENSSEDGRGFSAKREAEADDGREPEVFSNLEGNNGSLHKSDVKHRLTPQLEKVICRKISPANKNRAQRKSPGSEIREKDESALKHCLENSVYSEKNNCQDSGEYDGEVEIIRVLSNRSSVWVKANPCEKSTEVSPKERLIANSEPVEQEELEEDDYDSRDDSEDDKNTVIFEEESQKDSDLDEFYEMEEKEVTRKKFSNREITNRKRQMLVKFRRKRMAGLKIKVTEGAAKEQEACQKPAECVSEECLREVCSLVERLHELYRIILQLKKELPKNAELAVHFKRVINAQQENFHKEIRKSQKTIIKCYEKMLSVYRDTSQVAQVIGKRTSLSVEDIVNVISRCILIEGQCEAEEPALGNQALGSKNKKFDENLTRSAKAKINQSEFLPKQQMINSRIGFSSYASTNLLHVNHHPKLGHRPGGELVAPWEPPTKEKPPTASDSLVEESLQWDNDNHLKMKLKTQARMQQNPLPRHHFKKTTFEQSLKTGPHLHPLDTGLRHPFLHKPIERPPGIPNGQCRAGIMAPSVGAPQSSRDGLSKITGFFQQGNSPHPSAPRNEGTSNADSSFSMIPPALRNATEHNPYLKEPLQNIQNSERPTKATDGLRSGASLSVKNWNGSIANSRKGVIHPSEVQCPPDGVLTDSVRLSDHNKVFVKTVESSGRRCTLDSESVAVNFRIQDVPDPTIPQKLTMRNCRLEAGPILLGLQDNCAKKLSPSRLLIQKQKIRIEPRNLDRKDSNSRVYVCAQNDCESLGVRICKGCHSVIYCSETCQLKHWTLKHKSECYQLKALRG